MERGRLLAQRCANTQGRRGQTFLKWGGVMTAGNPDSRKLRLSSGLTADVLVKGRGTPLLFLHPAQGRVWSSFLDGLAQTYTVYAPLTPGAEEPEELMSLDAF